MLKMDDYIFFSKSNWRETPRLRHQLADLIRKFGGKVHFYQKPLFFWQKRNDEEVVENDGSLILARTRQLIHHQLRVFSVFMWLNALIEKRSIHVALDINLSQKAIIVNFNYDYFFLRDIFPNNKIITIINDDFVAQSKFFSGNYVRDSLKKTCEESDLVLAVSYPLMRQVSDWCSPKLFFPWADVKYNMPAGCSERHAVLLWAHINVRIDFDLLRQSILMRPDMIFYIVGPQAPNIKHQISLIESAVNVVIIPFSKLNDLPLEIFFAAIIPYKKNVADIEAVTMSNKSLQLMSRGLPIITYGMPSFYEHPAILKANDINEFVTGLDYFRQNFSTLQVSIENLISDNQDKNRFDFLRNLILEINVEV